MTPSFLAGRRQRTHRSLFALGLVALAALPGAALAQSAGSRIDQPTPGTLPPSTSTVPGDASGQGGTDGGVAPPSAIRSSTDVMKSDGGVQGQGTGGGTDPLKHLPKDMR